MRLEIIDKAEKPFVPQRFLRGFIDFMEKELQKRKILKKSSSKKLLLAFMSAGSIQKLNKKFLNKDKAADVLSFSPLEEDSFGELALCREKIKTQAKDHKLTIKEETAYLVLHGFLHLLGYHHEKGGSSAEKMYKIQDEIFEKWLKKGSD